MDFVYDQLTAAGIATPTIDTPAGMTIGATSATSVQVGRATKNIVIPGNLQMNSTVNGSSTAGQILVTTTAGVAYVKAASFSDGQLLTIDSTAGDSTNVAWKALSAASLTSTATGDLLVGNGSSTFSILPVGTTGKVLTVVAGTPSWQTPTVSTRVEWTALVLTGQAAVSPVLSVNSDLSVYSVVNTDCHFNIDVNVTMSGTGADTVYLDFNSALSPGIACTGTSRFIGACLIESATTLQTGFIHLLSSFSSGTRMTVYTTGFFAAGVTYRINGSLKYKIN